MVMPTDVRYGSSQVCMCVHARMVWFVKMDWRCMQPASVSANECVMAMCGCTVPLWWHLGSPLKVLVPSH